MSLARSKALIARHSSDEAFALILAGVVTPATSGLLAYAMLRQQNRQETKRAADLARRFAHRERFLADKYSDMLSATKQKLRRKHAKRQSALEDTLRATEQILRSKHASSEKQRRRMREQLRLAEATEAARQRADSSAKVQARTTMQQHAERLAAAREREGALAAQLAEQGEQHRASTAKLGARVASLCDRLRLAEVDRQQGASTIELQAEKLDAAAGRLRQSAAERQQGDNTIRLQAQRLAAAGRREHALVGQLAATAEELRAAKRKRGHAEARAGLAHEAVKIKREKLDDAEDRLEDSQELGQQLTIFQDGLMTHIDALQAQIRAAGGVPITKEAALAQGRP